MESCFANEFPDEANKDRASTRVQSDLFDLHELPSDIAATGEIHNWSSSSSSSSSTSSLDQDLFEFFSGDHHSWSTSKTASTYSNILSSHDVAPADSILFCGKLFPSQQPSISITSDHRKLISSSRTVMRPPTSNVGVFRRNYSDSSNYYMQRSKSSSVPTTYDSRIPRSKSVPVVPRIGSLARKSGDKKDNNDNGHITPKARDGHGSILKWTTKSRWFVFMFGMTSPSGSAAKKMELSDLRSRLINHRSPSPMLFRTSSSSSLSPDGHDQQLVGGTNLTGKSYFSFRCFGGL